MDAIGLTAFTVHSGMQKWKKPEQETHSAAERAIVLSSSRSVQVPPLLSSDTLPEGRCAVSKGTVSFRHGVLSTRRLTGP